MRIHRKLSFYTAIIVVLVSVNAFGQKGGLDITYSVGLTDTAKQEFHVTTDIRNIRSPQMTLALPTWTPGWYTVENYYKNVSRFRVTDDGGRVLPIRMTRKQTWEVPTAGIGAIRVEYDYRATVLALNQAKITPDFAFFTGIEMFLEPVGYRTTPSKVKFKIPAGWQIVTALKETADPMTFAAADYDTLVDAPVEMGRFDVTKFEVEGKPHYFVANPAGAFNKEKTDRFINMLSRVAAADSAMFGGLPYEKYVYFYFFTPPESNASGALEHLNSFVAFAPPGNIATPEMLIGTASHEFFHLWNVKRIRPAEMWPYDYSRENETPLLWVSEGFTNYYGLVATYRAGITSKEQFLAAAAGAAAGVENNEARKYISMANSSVSTWVGYDSPTAFGISYYGGGQNLAALLDLSIRNDTDGRSSLDDVMRTLLADHYKKGRGFTTTDMIGIINRLTGKDYRDFYDRFVFGTDVPDYDKFFGYAGYRVERRDVTSPVFGFNVRNRNGGFMVNGVEPDSPAAAAGLNVGDVITAIDGLPPMQAPFGSLAGKEIMLTVDRGGAKADLRMKVGTERSTAFSLVDVAKPNARQIAIRDGWLRR